MRVNGVYQVHFVLEEIILHHINIFFHFLLKAQRVLHVHAAVVQLIRFSKTSKVTEALITLHARLSTFYHASEDLKHSLMV